MVGDDLSLSAVFDAILGSERSWKGFLTFCEEVMTEKEAAERVRRGEISATDDGGGRRLRGDGIRYRLCRHHPAHLRP